MSWAWVVQKATGQEAPGQPSSRGSTEGRQRETSGVPPSRGRDSYLRGVEGLPAEETEGRPRRPPCPAGRLLDTGRAEEVQEERLDPGTTHRHSTLVTDAAQDALAERNTGLYCACCCASLRLLRQLEFGGRMTGENLVQFIQILTRVFCSGLPFTLVNTPDLWFSRKMTG